MNKEKEKIYCSRCGSEMVEEEEYYHCQNANCGVTYLKEEGKP